MLPLPARRADGKGDCRILDLGTGTGAIALALRSAVPRRDRDRRRYSAGRAGDGDRAMPGELGSPTASIALHVRLVFEKFTEDIM